MKALFSYRVTFQTQVQVDGWTSHLDLEYKTEREVVTVKAHNERHAKQLAVKKGYGYMTHYYPRHIDWGKEDIKNVYRLPRREKK